MEYVRIYSQSGQMLAVLENAGDIAYELAHNDLWVGSFSLPANDPKNAYCLANNLVTLPDGTRELGLYRIIGAPDNEAAQMGGKATYEVEHVMATLLDDLLFGSCTLGGNMRQALETILTSQDTARWQLGVCDFVTCGEQTFENTPLLTAMMALAETLEEEYTWDFDVSTTPWTVNLRRADDLPGCGILYRRSLRGIRKSMDATSLVTRLYLLGSGEGAEQVTVRSVNNGLPYIDADTAGTWGVKCAVWTHKGISDPAELLRRGRLVLEQRKNPYMSYEVDAIDLYRQTGDAWDNVMPGKLAKIMDEENGIVIQARVKKIGKKDTKGDPGSVVITIANAPRDIADVLTEEINRATAAEDQLNATVNENAKAARASAAGLSARLDSVEINLDDANARIELKAEKTTVSLLGERVSAAEIAIDGANARIDLKANQTDVTAIGERVSAAEIAIDGANARIDLKADQSTVTSLGTRVSSAEVAIEGANAAIALKVTKGDVATQLAVECGNVSITGGNLAVSGYLAVDNYGQFSGTLTSTNGNISAPYGNIGGSTLSGNSITLDGEQLTSYVMSFMSNSWTVASDGNISLEHYHAITCSENNGVVTITQGAAQATAGSDSFNIADTRFYQDGLVSAWNDAVATVRINNSSSGAGDNTVNLASGGSVTVYAQAKAGASASSYSTYGTVTVNAEAVTIDSVNGSQGTTWGTYYIPITMTATASNGATGSNTINANASDVYTAGETDGYNTGYAEGVNDGYATGEVSVTVSSVVKYQADAYDTDSHNYTVYVRGTASNGATKDNSLSVNGASAYNAGSAAGAAGVTISSVTGSAGTAHDTYYIPVTMTATASNNATGSGSVEVNAYSVYSAGYSAGYAAAPVNPTISQCYVSSFSVSRVAKYGDGYEVTGSVSIRVNFSNGTHTTYGPYSVRDVA